MFLILMTRLSWSDYFKAIRGCLLVLSYWLIIYGTHWTHVVLFCQWASRLFLSQKHCRFQRRIAGIFCTTKYLSFLLTFPTAFILPRVIFLSSFCFGIFCFGAVPPKYRGEGHFVLLTEGRLTGTLYRASLKLRFVQLLVSV